MKDILKKSSITALAIVGIGVVISQVSARQIGDYDVTIPRFGNITTTTLYKENHTNGVHQNDAIGGNKRINTSIQLSRTGADITGSYQMGPGDVIYMPYHGGAGAYIGSGTKLSIATPVSTVVKVQAQGSWSPDAQ
ncbi:MULTISPECIES: hypothetical protein [unclassified Streptococcus]|uniref:hypothetical protein n=1 Tax=unclassified Streptococcus TaxID=2608887 RepID=UPI00359DC860